MFDRTSDRLRSGKRSSPLPAIVGLFDGNYCRRCEARFSITRDEKDEHREWHEWLDEQGRIEQPTRADELVYYLTACVPPKGYVPDGEVLPLAPPTRAQLDKHRKLFEPQGVTFSEQRRQHAAAVDEVARLYGLAGEDLERMIRDARDEGLSVPEIADRCGVPQGTVRRVVLGRSAPSKTTSTAA